MLSVEMHCNLFFAYLIVFMFAHEVLKHTEKLKIPKPIWK